MHTLPPLSVAGRIDRVRDLVAARGCDAMVVHDPTDIRWCTGFTGSHALLVVGPGATTLLTDGRYTAQAPAQLAEAGARGVGVEIATDLDARGAALVAAADRIALEADVVTWEAVDRWRAATRGELVATTGLIAELRAVKDEAELARMAAAAAIVDDALAEVRPMLRAGITERTIASALDGAMRERGAAGPAYETIVAAGPNAALPHARPGDRPLEEGDLVVVDAGALVEGYRSDMTRTFCVGAPDARALELHQLVTRAQAAGVAGVRPGVTAGEIDDLCRGVIAAAGRGAEFTHGTGHGVGLDIHELPAVRKGNTAILQPGHVLTVEPGVYAEGYGGVRVEDMVVVTTDGCRPLTQYPKEPLCPPSPPTT